MAVEDLEQTCINTIRTLAMDAVQKANSGHPGAPMGMAPMAYALWTRFLKHNPANPNWSDRDRFVLSAGHASMLLYSLLYLTGYDLSLDDIKQFRQFDSKTPGHPEYGVAPGVEATTGPLGQGFAMGLGMAIAERHLAQRFNRPGFDIVDHYTYVICSDGDMMEGIASEAASLAGMMGLGKMVYLYDDNGISIEGSTDLAFTEDVGRRFEAYGWHVQHVADGNDVVAITNAIQAAREETERPSLIVVATVIAYGSPNKGGTADAHGTPLGAEEIVLTKRNLGWPENESFYVPEEALGEYRQAVPKGRQREDEWNKLFAEYEKAYPQEAAEWTAAMDRILPKNWDADLPVFKAEDGSLATRVASGRVLNALAPRLPALIGGSSDLAPSNDTYLKGLGDFTGANPAGRNLRFGVREHAMGGAVNGMALHGGVIPYGGTFLTFSDYMRGAVRIASLMGCRSTFVYTHDSIGLGEDGPTHQPIEHLAALRAMPVLSVYRPADANETAQCWRLIIERSSPAAIALTRQGLPILGDVDRIAEGVPHGGYVLADAESGTPDVILIATGSEVSLALKARELLSQRGAAARVVSLPCWEVFDEQEQSYRDSVLPPSIKARVSVEAGAALGWHRFVGDAGATIAIDHFGASAPGGEVMKRFGFTPEAVADAAEAVIARVRAGGPAEVK